MQRGRTAIGTSKLVFLFEDYSLDRDRRELRRGPSLVPVEPQVFDLLLFLITSRDRVVSRDDLLGSVWGGRTVSESTLATRINAARRAVGDTGEQQRLIRTLHRKGFRFIGVVREVEQPAGSVDCIPAVSSTRGDVGTPDRPCDFVTEALPRFTSLDANGILARANPPEADKATGRADPDVLSFEAFSLDPAGQVAVDAGGREIPLTAAEFATLVVFARNPGRVLSRDQLLGAIGGGADPYDSSIDVMISRLRWKIVPDPKAPRLILTVPGAGYKFAAKPASSPPATARPSDTVPQVLPAAVEVLAGGPSSPTTPSGGRPAERRQLTIMACELVGAATLSGRLDAEAFRVVLEAHHRHCREVIETHNGHVASYQPDGLIAYFGEPRAREHDAENALRAGLALAANAISGGPEATPHLLVRIGIASGTVIMDQLVAGVALPGRVAVGEAPNLAQQLSAAANPGGVIVARNTRDLVRGLFEYRPVGPIVLEGSSEPVDAWQVLRASDTASRFDARREHHGGARIAAPRRSLSPFVGRGRELETLGRFDAAGAGRIRAIDIVGEPGIGKSRLLHEFRADLIGRKVFVLSGSCWPDSQETAFRPFIEVVRRAFRLRAGSSEKEVARELERGLTLLGLPEAENIGLLMNLLGLAPPQDALKGLSDVLVGQRTRELLMRLVYERSRFAPLALLLEDLHWIDLASQQLLAQLIGSGSSLPLLVVTTSRPEYRSPWAGLPDGATLRLEPLSAADTARIVESRLDCGMDGSAIVPLVVGKAEGNPLFAEEITNYLVERVEPQGFDASRQASGTNPPMVLPASVQALLASRVDRLARADKSLLQAASVIGRQFSADLLAAVTDVRADLGSHLAVFEELDLVRCDGRTGEFVFKHALVRDALYESLLGAKRAELHLTIATEIERAAKRPIEVAEVLAHHYARTTAVDKAIEFLAMAGRKSVGIYSVAEAERFLSQALTLARAQEQNGLDERGLNIMADLARVLTLQFKPREIIALVEPDAGVIARFVANVQVPILLYFYGFALFTARRFVDGRQIQERALEIAELQDDRRAKAYAIAGVIFLSTVARPLPLEDLRRLAAAGLAHAESAGDVYLVGSLMMSVAWNYSLRGLVVDAAEWARRLLAFGRDHRDGRAVAIGLWISGWLDVLAEDYASAIQHGEECVAAATTQVDRMMGSVVMANAQILSGSVAEGMALNRRVRDEAEANHWSHLFSAIDGPLGVAMVLSGRIKDGLSWLAAFVRRDEGEGELVGADLARLFLAEIYLSLLVGDRRPSWRVVARNALPLIKARLQAAVEVERLLGAALRNPFFSPNGIFRARIEFNLGRFHRARRRLDLAREHFQRARAAASAQKAEVICAKIDAALGCL